ncbi:Fe-S-containing hydro-lyase [Metallumcola ferriviriculae]|uniref:Fe-S-containing hydro-lyase n=1 Tax=Metallumcola ferriviriculae TaxID=3039180 RepID=A0AAU0UMW7_9FIRM|nr:Fe-S-containing hydro-lyase [Desulfitibacteraceae bacterium MK1]
MAKKYLTSPLTDKDVEELEIGDQVLISGTIYTARDAAHKRLVDLLAEGKELPIELQGQIIYYVGPTPAKPGQVIGSAGPTTSYRMDPYAPKLLEMGLKAMIGKGSRSQTVKDAMAQYKGCYLAAVGGAAALIAKSIKEAEVVAYPELGPEAIRKLRVEEFPAVVINDCHGGDLYQDGVKKYQK